MLFNFKVSIVGDKKSSEMYREDCELTVSNTGLNVVEVESLEDEIDRLDDDGYDDALDEDADFTRDWKYFYLVTIEDDRTAEELEKFLWENLIYYDLESSVSKK